MSLRLALLLLLALPGHAWKVGPMPDFAPLGEVVAHRYIESRAPKLVPALRQQLGRRFRLETWTPCPDGSCDDLKLSWMRDYTPTFVRRRDGDLAVRTCPTGTGPRCGADPSWSRFHTSTCPWCW